MLTKAVSYVAHLEEQEFMIKYFTDLFLYKQGFKVE